MTPEAPAPTVARDLAAPGRAGAPPEAPSYDSAERPAPYLHELRLLWRRRELVVQLVRRDIVTRYKRSVLGVAWTILNPLGTMAVLAVVFSNAFAMGRGYATYVLAGLLVWNFFAQTTVAAMRQLVSGATLMRRIAVPRTVFTVSAVGAGVVNLALALLPLAGIMLLTGVPVRPAALWLLVAVPVMTAFTLGVALAVSVLAVYFTDAAELYAIALPAMLYLTPIIYPRDILPAPARPWLADGNPLYHLVSLFRTPLHEGRPPDAVSIAVALGVAAAALVGGWLLFTSRADDLASRV